MMAVSEYPNTLPMPIMTSQDVSTVEPTVRTKMQSGRSRARRAFTSTPKRVRVKWKMRDAQAAVFEGWFRWGLSDGADWFNADMRTMHAGIKPVTMRFTGVYDGPDPIGFGIVEISAEVELKDRQTYSEVETANALAGGNLHEIVQQADAIAQNWYRRTWENES